MITNVTISLQITIEHTDEEDYSDQLNALCHELEKKYEADVDVLSEDEDEPFEEFDNEEDTE